MIAGNSATALASRSLVVFGLLFYVSRVSLPIPVGARIVVVLRAVGLAVFLLGASLTVWARQVLGAM